MKQVKSPDFTQVSSVSDTDNLYTTVGTARKGYFVQASQIRNYVVAAVSSTYQDLTTSVGFGGLKQGTWYFIPAPTGVYAGGTTYALDDEVTDGSGNYYKSLQGSNTGNALTDTAFWKPVLRDIYLRAITTALFAQQAEIIKGGVSKSVYYDFDNDNELYFTYVDTTQVGTTAATSEETLASMTLWGNVLGIDGDYIKVTASGTFAANTNQKTLKIKFGSTCFDGGAMPHNDKNWIATAYIYRLSANSQTAVASVYSSDKLPSISWGNTESLSQINSLTEALASSVTVSITGQNGTANANDIVLEAFTVEHIGQ